MRRVLLIVPLVGVLAAGTMTGPVAAAGRGRAVRYLETGHAGLIVRVPCGRGRDYTGLVPYYPLASAGSGCRVRIWIREFVPPLGGPAWCVSPGQRREPVPAGFRYAADIQVTGNGRRCPAHPSRRSAPGQPAAHRLAVLLSGIT